MDQLSPPGSIGVASSSYLDLEIKEEETLTPPDRPPTEDEILARRLLKEETAFLAGEPVVFSQFPSTLYAHTEDGIPFERLKELARSNLSEPSKSLQSSQISKLAEHLRSAISDKLSGHENLSVSDINSSSWNRMLHAVLSENLSTSQISASLSHHLQEAVLHHLDAQLSTTEASVVGSVHASLKNYLHDVLSIDNIHASIKSFLHDALSEHSIFEKKDTISVSVGMQSSQGGSKSVNADPEKSFQKKLRSLNAQCDIFFVEKELKHLCKRDSFENIQHRPFESKVNDKFIDQYNLEYADMTFLEKPPKNYIIFNKPGIDASKLAAKVHERYGAVIIDPKTVLQAELSRPGELQETLADLLAKGKCINSSTLFKLILKEISSSNGVRNNGYILSGVPMYRFSDGVQDADQISARDQLEEIFALQNRPNIIIYLFCPNPCLVRLRSLTNTDSNTGYEHNLGISRTVKIHEILLAENSPHGSDVSENDEALSEEDEEEKDSNYIRNQGGNKIFAKGFFQETHDTNPKYPNLPNKDVLYFILEDYKKASENLTSILKSVRAQNLITNVGLQTIKYFQNTILPLINEYVLSHDVQYYIRLDARLPTSQNFTVIQHWLKNLCFVIPKASSLLKKPPIDKILAGELSEEEEEDNLEEDGPSTPISMYKEAQYLNCIDSFDWKLSQFGFKCPVSLFNGTCDIGKLSFSATYLSYVYFCKTKACLDQFLEDPKKYIKDPNPKPPFKFIVIGFTGCDLQTISQKLCEKFYLKYVHFNSLMEKYVIMKRNKIMEDFKTHARNRVNDNEVFEVIKGKILERKISIWKNEVLHMIKLNINADSPIETKEEEEGGSSEQFQLYNFSAAQLYEAIGPMPDILKNRELCERILQNYNILDEYVPKNLEDIVENDCQEKIEELAELAVWKDFDPRLSLEDVKNAISILDDVDSFDSSLVFVKKELPPYKGWVLNGLPVESKLWAVLQDSNVFSNEIVFIYNSNDTPDSENIGDTSEEKQPKIIHSDLSDIISSINSDEPEKYNGPNRNKLASIQEKYLKFTCQKDELRMDQAPSSFMIDEQVLEENSEIEETDKIQESKRITFVSQVEYIPYSDKLEYYAINDRILFHWNDIKSSVFSEQKNTFIEIDVLQTTDILKEIEDYVLSKYDYPLIDSSDTNEQDEASNTDSDAMASEDLLGSKDLDLGDTLFFCPVAIKEHKQLILGDTKHCVQYRNKTYYFISKKNKEKFKLNPEFYVNFKKPLDSINFGPWKVCVLTTVCGSGELFCQKLASNLNLTFANFNYVFERDIVPAGTLPIGVLYEDPATRFELAFKDKVLLKDLQVLRQYFNSLEPLLNKEHISILVDRYWSFQHPYSNGFLYYRFPHTLNDFKYLVSNMLLPDVIIELKVPENIIERTMSQIKFNWTVHKGAIKKEIILYDQDLKLKYEVARKRVFRFVLNTVWSREITLKEGGTIDPTNDDILERIEAEIEYAKGNTNLLEELMVKYSAMDEVEELLLSEDDTNSLFYEVDEVFNFDSEYSNIKRLSNSLEHTPSIRNIAIRYGLEPKDIDMNVIRQIHKIVCQIVPKPNYKMKSLNQKLNDPEYDAMSTHETELGEINKIRRVAKKLNIPWISSEPSEDNAAKCELNIKEGLCLKEPYCLEKVHEVTIKTAEKLLKIGYFYYSKYGRICPVEFHDTKITIQPYEKRLKQNEIHALIHRKYIYFIYGEKNKEKFMRNVLKYVNLNSTLDIFHCPLKLAVTGPVKSGKTFLSRILADYYDLEVITTGSALRYVQRNLSWTVLADHIESCLAKGFLVPDILVARCIEVLTHVGKAPVMGYVLDGVIRNLNLIHELAKLNIIPHFVIQLIVKEQRIITNLRTSTIPGRMFFKYCPDFIKFKLKNSGFPTKQDNLKDQIRHHWYNVITIDPITIQLNLNVIINEIGNIFLTLNENYAKMKNSNEGPIKLKHMCVSPYEYDSRLHCLIENCCVGCLVEKKQFVSKCLDRVNSVLYKENHFWLCPIHYEPFLSNPEQFLCKLDPVVFLERPRKIVADGKENNRKFLDMAENKGYCNVCFWNCLPNRIPEVNKGLTYYAILYREKLFLFCCERCMQTFCLRPEFYHDKEIHCMLPLLSVDQRTHIPSKELPLIGYVHEYLADVLQEALLSVGHLRPKYPFMSPQLSAALYLGYYLSSKVKSQLPCITNSFDDRQFQQFLARIDVLKLLANTLPWNYNPFLINLWLKEGKTDKAFRRTLKTIEGRFVAALKAIPDECQERGHRACRDRGDAMEE